MKEFKLLIDGRLVSGTATLPVINPATEDVLSAAPRASLRKRGQEATLLMVLNGYHDLVEFTLQNRRKARLAFAARHQSARAE